MKKTLKVYRGKEDFEDIVKYEYNSQNKPCIFITIYPTKEEYESLNGKNLEVTLLKTVEERLREAMVSAVKNKFGSIPVEDIRSLDLVLAIEEADTEFFKKENNE